MKPKTNTKFISLVIIALSFTFATSLTVRADAVSDWYIIANQSSAANVPARLPTQTSRILAMTQIAIHDALNSIDNRYEQYSYSTPGDPNAAAVAAVAAAAYNVLRLENPTQAANLLVSYNNMLATVPDGPAKVAGIAIGEASAASIRALRADDGSAAAGCPYTPGTGPGEWRPTPPAFAAFATPCWGSVTPFTMKSGDRWRPASHPFFQMNHKTYTREYREVKDYGGATSTLRTTDQAEASRFWYPNAMLTYGRVAAIFAADRNLDLWDSGRLFALLATSQADSLIAVWDAKLAFPFWRPLTAIREADTDGNPATEPDATWLSYMVTPPYPDYTSGHSGLDGGSSEILIRYFETDEEPFSLSTTLAPNPPLARSFTGFSQAARDGAESRIWGGLHFRSACEDALMQGKNIGRQVFNHHFRPVEDKFAPRPWNAEEFIVKSR